MGLDFFSQSLDSSEFFFVFPPVSLALNTLRFLESQKVQGIFIIQIWPTSLWFNDDGIHCYQWVQKMFLIRPNFRRNINSPSCFAEFVTYDYAALHFNFSKLKLGGRVIRDRSHFLLGGF